MSDYDPLEDDPECEIPEPRKELKIQFKIDNILIYMAIAVVVAIVYLLVH